MINRTGLAGCWIIEVFDIGILNSRNYDNDYVPFSNINSHYVYRQYVSDKICCPNQIYNMRYMMNHTHTEHLRPILHHCLTLGSLRILYDITEKNGRLTWTKTTMNTVLFTFFLLAI